MMMVIIVIIIAITPVIISIVTSVIVRQTRVRTGGQSYQEQAHQEGYFFHRFL